MTSKSTMLQSATAGVRGLAVLSVVGLLALTGCSKGSAKLVPVEGKVTVGSKPLPGGSIAFWPEGKTATADAPNPIGTIDADGNYKLTTAGKTGAAVGKYKVTVAPQVGGGASDPMQATTSPPKGAAGPSVKINPKYENQTTTDLTVEVTDKAAPGTYDLKVN